jgi:hypothetical protein
MKLFSVLLILSFTLSTQGSTEEEVDDVNVPKETAENDVKILEETKEDDPAAVDRFGPINCGKPTSVDRYTECRCIYRLFKMHSCEYKIYGEMYRGSYHRKKCRQKGNLYMKDCCKYMVNLLEKKCPQYWVEI